MREIDAAMLVLIAAAATGEDPDRVLIEANVGALDRVAAATEACSQPFDTAAMALMGFVRERPLPRGNRAAG